MNMVPVDMMDFLLAMGIAAAFGFAAGCNFKAWQYRRRYRPRPGSLDLMRGYEHTWKDR